MSALWPHLLDRLDAAVAPMLDPTAAEVAMWAAAPPCNIHGAAPRTLGAPHDTEARRPALPLAGGAGQGQEPGAPSGPLDHDPGATWR